MLRTWTLTAAALVAVLALACGDSEESAPPSTSPTNPVPSASASSTTPTGSPGPTAAWKIFYKPDQFGQARLRYPGDWYGESQGGIYSSNPSDWPSVCRPKGSMGIQASVLPIDESPRAKEATDFTLMGYSGWQLIEENTEDCRGRAHTVTIENAGLAYIIIFISDSAAEESIFQEILATFELQSGA